MEQKQKSQRTARLKKRLLTVALGTAFFGAGLVWIVWMQGSFIKRALMPCKLTTILALGRQHTEKKDLLKVLGCKHGDQLGELNLRAMAEAVLMLPWVKHVHIKRVWPDSLWVRIEEYQPFALWQRHGVHQLVDRGGFCIPVPFQSYPAWQSLIHVVGNSANLHAKEIDTILSTCPSLRKKIQSATYLPAGRWMLHLKYQPFSVKLPVSPTLSTLRIADNFAEIGKKWFPNMEDIRAIDLQFLPVTILVDLTPQGLLKRQGVEKHA